MHNTDCTSQDRRSAKGDGRNSALAIPAQGEPIIHDIRAFPGIRQHRGGGACNFARGFTLIELMLVVAVAGILSGMAYPSFMGQLQKMRRCDALVSLMQLQVAQERWRSNTTAYGTLADISVAPSSSAGHYALQVTSPLESSYEVLATAQGVQANDTVCRQLRMRVDGGNMVQTSGPDSATNNPTSVNRQCWNV